MYKIPDDITEVFLKDDIVKMICFNLNQIYIHFQSSVYIAIENQYIYNKNGEKQLFEVFPVLMDNGLLTLLEKQVRKIAISNSRKDLTIFFDEDTSIKLLGSVNYESYTIRIDDRIIII